MVEVFFAPIIKDKKSKDRWHFNSRIGCSLFELNYKISGSYKHAVVEIEMENKIDHSGYVLFINGLCCGDFCKHCWRRALHLYKHDREYFKNYIGVQNKP